YFQANEAGLEGELPTCICTMEYVQYFYASTNRLTGPIPECVAGMTYLREMHLDCNQLTGAVPTGFDELEFLEELLVQCNFDLICTELTGDFIYKCYWEDVECEGCNLEPIELTPCLPYVQYQKDEFEYCVYELLETRSVADGPFMVDGSLYANNNSMTTPIPDEICDLTNLKYWQMIDAGLTGDLPLCMCTMEYLQYAYLSFNMITGEIPTCVNQMTFLRELHLDCNLLEGPVPVEFDELEFLEELWVQCNFDLICTELTGDFIYICGSDLPECLSS
ncbi:hypothetical protein KIPB_011293, partial [Kipferlia bialata]